MTGYHLTPYRPRRRCLNGQRPHLRLVTDEHGATRSSRHRLLTPRAHLTLLFASAFFVGVGIVAVWR